MKDDNWELIDGEAAHAIEVLNYLSQCNVIEALVIYSLHHFGTTEEQGCPRVPTVTVLREFHRTATLFLLAKPGFFREEHVQVRTGSGTVIHDPPPHTEVTGHIATFFSKLESAWPTMDAVAVGAFTLWFVNWVHPFKNGNGRSARALSYACVCLKYGFVLPGAPTLIDLVMQPEHRGDYNAHLSHADATFAATGSPDLIPMESFVERLLEAQLGSLSPN